MDLFLYWLICVNGADPLTFMGIKAAVKNTDAIPT
jgi:hypothetical protein